MSGAGRGQSLRLPLTERRFDLREVMDAVGEWPDLDWVLRDAWLNGDVRSVWPGGHAYAEAASEEAGGLRLTWRDMKRIAQDCLQVIDAQFTGYDKGQPVLQLLAIDSSYWVVWARDTVVVDRVRVHFPEAEPIEEPEPAPQ